MKKQYLASVALVFAVQTSAWSLDADEDEEALKQDAVTRVVQSHDPALSVHIGRVYVKQVALLAARDLLARRGQAAGLGKAWNPSDPLWRGVESELMQGVDGLIQRKVASTRWVQEAWTNVVSRNFSGEQADEIAMHFQTEGGQLQRRVIEWFVGELTLQTYTFTGRLKYGVPGSEQEMKDLQVVTYERIFPGVQDFTRYENTVRFASIDPGVKYFKTMVIQGVHALHIYLEARADEARAMIQARAAMADPYIAQAQRTAQ